MRGAIGGELPPGPRLPTPVQTLALWRWPLGYLERCRERYGSRFTVRTTGYPPFVFVSDPQDLKAIFGAPADALHAGEGGMTLEPLLGESSFMLRDEEEHLAGRRAVLPAFHGRAVQRHAEEIEALARRAVATWPRDRPIALHRRLHTLTLEIVLRAIFGAGRDERLRALAERLLEMLSITASAVLPEPFLRHGPGARIWKRFERRRAECDELIFALLEEGGGGGGWVPDKTSEPGGLLARLLAASNPDGSPMSREQLRDNVVTIIVSGHETTASELEWAFQLLAHHPAVLRRLLDEIDGDAGDEYLTATVNEVLRHRPAFLFMIPRAVKRPIETRRLDSRASSAARLHLPHAPRPGALSRAPQVPSRALPRRPAGRAGLAAVGRGAQALSRPAHGDAGDEGGAGERAEKRYGAPRGQAHGAPTLAQRGGRAPRGFASCAAQSQGT